MNTLRTNIHILQLKKTCVDEETYPLFIKVLDHEYEPRSTVLQIVFFITFFVKENKQTNNNTQKKEVRKKQ